MHALNLLFTDHKRAPDLLLYLPLLSTDVCLPLPHQLLRIHRLSEVVSEGLLAVPYHARKGGEAAASAVQESANVLFTCYVQGAYLLCRVVNCCTYKSGKLYSVQLKPLMILCMGWCERSDDLNTEVRMCSSCAIGNTLMEIQTLLRNEDAIAL